ncbi:BTAD domain-containing putative transcriptional regulator [Actinoplanes sp. NPDC049599]|uniref:BTAD domain-containing putative transcriptional regulator n=1 Tax=Actinoplanes sp. NPDC049599 TaxID=3363903 RepID=UPI0037B1519D
MARDGVPDPWFEQAVGKGLAVLEFPDGQVLSEHLATALAGAGRTPLWLRLDAGDDDPAAPLLALARGLGRHAGPADTTLAAMRSHPGPVSGWPRLVDLLAGELAGALAETGALVLEHAHLLRGTGPTAALLAGRLLPRLRHHDIPCVVLAHGESALASLLAAADRWTPRDLRPAPPEAAGEAVRAAQALLGEAAGRRLQTAAALPELLEGVARQMLPLFDDDQLAALGRAVVLEYGQGEPSGPWWQPLEGDWYRVRGCWRAPLAAALDPRYRPGPAELRGVAHHLINAGAVAEGVALSLDAHDDEGAAGALLAHADELMDDGRWATLERLIDRLPTDVLHGRAELLHLRGEIALAARDPGGACRFFDAAAARFAARPALDRACHSMLAASTAVTATDLGGARARSAAALSFAEASGDPATLSWAIWQEAATALLAGGTDAALLGFRRAARAAAGGPAAEHIRVTDELSREILGCRGRHEEIRNAQTALERRVGAVLDQLRETVSGPGSGMPAATGRWSADPAPVRLRRLPSAGPRWLAPAAEQEATPAQLPAGARPERPAAAPGPTVIAQLLGPFALVVDETPVPAWSSGRMRSLFAYLVTHRRPGPSREALTEALWPGAEPASARNSLNVALHSLRRALREVTPSPVVLFREGGYRLHPAVRLWLDVDLYDERAAAARRLPEDDVGRKGARYEEAIGLYHGDFLAEDLDSLWTAEPRERLRAIQIDALGTLGQLRFRTGEYARAAELCRQLLTMDPCREQAHRLLMRCHSRQGLPHLALLQFRECVLTLRTELKVEPAPETVALYRKIRRHEPV